MSEPTFLQNPSSKNFLILAPHRADRPDDGSEESTCPFCPGNEAETPPEILRVPDSGNWTIRVVPNKYPITNIHEVVVLTPNHEETPLEHSVEHWQKIFEVYKNRFNALREKGSVSIFHNHGPEAGESRKHDHAQILVVPKEIEIRPLETEPIENLVHESEEFFVYCPAASSWPFECVILPKARNKFFGEIEKPQMEDLATIFPTLLKKLEENQGKNLPFNYYIYHDRDWYIRVIPRLKIPAGFEIATGIFVNTQDPKEACEKLSW